MHSETVFGAASPQIAQKTVEYFVNSENSTLAAGSWFNSTFNVEIPESSPEIVSAWIEVDGLAGDAGTVDETNSYEIYLNNSRIGAGVTMINGRESNFYRALVNASSAGANLYSISSSGNYSYAISFRTLAGFTPIEAASMRLFVTYNYDSEPLNSPIQTKTAKFFINNSAALITATTTLNNTFSINLPENNVVVKSAWIEVTGTTDGTTGTVTLLFNGTKLQKGISAITGTGEISDYVIISNASCTAASLYSLSGNNPSADYKLGVNPVSNEMGAFSAIAVITYTYDASSATQLNTVEYFVNSSNEAQTSITPTTSTLNGSYTVQLPEATPSVKSAWFEINCFGPNSAAGAMNLDVLVINALTVQGDNLQPMGTASQDEESPYIFFVESKTSGADPYDITDNNAYTYSLSAQWTDSACYGQSAKQFITYIYNKSLSANALSTNKYFVGQQNAVLASPNNFTSNFTIKLPQTSPSVKSAYLESTGQDDNDAVNAYNIYLNGTLTNYGSNAITTAVTALMFDWVLAKNASSSADSLYNINTNNSYSFNYKLETNGESSYGITQSASITYSYKTDFNAPAYSLNSTNSTAAGRDVLFSLYWTDSALAGCIFSFDNGTGTFTNDSFVAMTGTGNWSNVTKSINSTIGSTIQWRVYANDSSGNMNTSLTYSFLTNICTIANFGTGSCTEDGACNITGGTVTMDGTCTFTELNITSTGTLTHPQLYGLNLSSGNMTIFPDGKIDVSGKGYAGGAAQSTGDGPSAGKGGFYAGGGGGYGGYGGYAYVFGKWGYGGTTYYGNITDPDDFGSGGGGGWTATGSPGGGLIRMNISGTLTNNGTITAAGNDGTSNSFGSWGGAGAGGTIYITAGTFAGNGTISAKGGISELSAGILSGYGGGGRIAIYYTEKKYTGTITSSCGDGTTDSSQYGGAGTIYLEDTQSDYTELIIDNNGKSGAETAFNASASYDSMTVQSGANIISTIPVLNLTISVLKGNGIISLVENSTNIHTSNISMNGGSITSTSGQINITFSSTINITNFNASLSTSTGAINIIYGSIKHTTGFNAAGTITRTFTTWSEAIMKWNDTNGTVGLTANYNLTGLSASTTYYIYNVTYGTQTNPYTLTTDLAGALSFNISLNGNTEIRVTDTPDDTSPPEIYIQSPQNNTYGTNSIWFNVTLDEAGSWCGYSLDGAANATMDNQSGNWNSENTSMAEGSHYVTFSCNDTAGNMNSSSITEYFTFDTTYPKYSLNQTNSTEAGSDILFSLYWEDNIELAGYIFSFDNGTGTFENDTYVTMTGTLNWSNVTKTVNSTASTLIRWIVYANDTTGNMNTSDTYSFLTTSTGDSTPPQITIQSPQNTTYKTQSIWFNITGSETLNWSAYSLDGASNITLVNSSGNWWAKNNSVTEGAHTVVFWANDSAGLMNSTEISFTIDLTYPLITIQSPKNTTYTTIIIDFNITGSETLDWSGYSLDGADIIAMINESGVWWAQNSSMADGSHTVEFFANDSAGNMNSTSIMFTINTTVPLIWFEDPTPANNSNFDMNWTYINTSVADYFSPNNLTALIDFNHSLVGWWRFNLEAGENDTLARDWSYWENNGTISNTNPGIDNCTGNCSGWTTRGKFGYGMWFDGVNDYVNMGSDASLNLSNAWTIEAWIKKNSTHQGAIISNYNSAGDNAQYHLEVGMDDKLMLLSDAGAATGYIGSSILQNDVWYHVAGTYYGSTWSLYLDGIAETLSGNSDPPPASGFGDTTIGRAGDTSTYFNGTIDEVRIFNRALSEEEINASYNAGLHRLYHNFTNLTNGNYKFTAYVQNLNGNTTQTETRKIILGVSSYLEVNLSEPDTETPINVVQNTTFLVNATIICRGGNCGNVAGTIRYNKTTEYPDTPINETLGADPFYINEIPAASTKSCNNNPLSDGMFCNLTWLLNATGAELTSWKIGVNFSSDAAGVLENTTSNATINIIPCFVDISVGWSSIEFENSLVPNTYENPALGNADEIYNITINSGSCNTDLYIKGTNMENISLGYSLGIGNLTWSNNSNTYTASYNMTQAYNIFKFDVPPVTNITTWYWINVPPIYAAYYNGTVFIQGVKSGSAPP